MKILHTADTHLGDLTGPVRDGRNARREDTLRCMRAIAESAAEEKPDIAIIAGDLFNRSRVWADTALDDINDAITEFLLPICRASTHTVLLFGTSNHDNPKAFHTLEKATIGIENLHISTTPEVFSLITKDGEEIQILTMPGFEKGRLRAFMPDADAETENLNATTLVNEIIMGNAAKLNHQIPSILVAHYTVAGAEGESGQTFLAGQDVVITPQTIDGTGVTLATFGHIHKPQRLGSNTPAFYCGSPNELTFNDEGIEHGFYYHTIEDRAVTESRFITTPARKHYTLRLSEKEIAEFIGTGEIAGIDGQAKDAIVRVIYKATEDQEKQLNRAALQAFLLGKTVGAFYVPADFTREDTGEAKAKEASMDDTPQDALHRYLTDLKEGGMDITDTDLTRLEELAAPIIHQADDGREADQHTGAFIPKRIEVTNYRSYARAEFGFEEIRMAMVNGPNGVGKSSLFMDSIADCLYETSRDGAVGEWLRVGEKKGAIIFEFEMGGYDWRVSRTRNASRKGTLALARKNAETGEWENESDTTMALTQDRITKIIGMDAQTFCSIALIRQDAYGLFLETDSDRRMEVLSTLLNLGLYTRAEEIAKEKASEQRKAIAQLNDRMNVLDEQMAAKEEIEKQLEETAKEYATKETMRKATENMIKEAEKQETLRQEMIRQAGEKSREADELDKQAAEKEAELKKQTAERDEAQALAGMAETARIAAETIEQARVELEPLAGDEEKLKHLTARKDELTATVDRLDRDLGQIKAQISVEKTTLENRAEIEAAVAEIEAVRKEREALAPRTAEYEEAKKVVGEAEKKRDSMVADSRVRITDLTHRINEASKKVAILAVSGCPNIETATCEFLKDAKAAKEEKDTLQPQLDEMKAKDKAEYDRLTAEIESAKARLEAMENPQEALATLAEREKKAAPVASHAGKLDAAVATLEQLTKQKEEKQTALGEAEKERDEVADQIPALTETAKKAKELRDKIKASEPAAALQAKCAAAEATVRALEVTLDLLSTDAEKRRQRATETRREASEMMAKIPTEDSNLETLRQNMETLASEEQELKKTEGGLQAKLEGIEEARTQWEAYRTEKATAAKTLVDYQMLASAFGLDGIQYAIIKSTVPEIQDRANAILAAMTSGRMAVDFRTEREQTNKKIVNSLDVWINTLSGIARPYASHSGGEKVKIALAVTLGLADVKAHRAGVQLGMLWIDEPPFLDQDGTDAYADALVTMANRNPEMRILAISHDPQMKARFPQNITVSAGENGSEVAMG